MTAPLKVSSTPATSSASPLMEAAIKALGNEKYWTGTVTGLLGFFHRTFEIKSTGMYTNGHLVFAETITFNDGVSNQRTWTISEKSDGLHIHADNIKSLKPGRLEGRTLVFDYRLNLGRFALPYRDEFIPHDDGHIENVGRVTVFCVTIMKILVRGETVR